MLSRHIKLWYVLINAMLCHVQCEVKSRKLPRRLTKLLKTDDIRVSHSTCGNLPPRVLTDVLGAAFNSRYMSIDQPKYLGEDNYQSSYSSKRNSEPIQPFYVEDTFAIEISNKPAWEVKHTSDEYGANVIDDGDETTMKSVRSKRDHGSNNIELERPWECKAKIKWIDLGPDYFPRFLRSVECTRERCWYNHYVCKPRSFTVKLLRRRNGECVQTNQLRTITNEGMPGEFKELWVWEERAVNFCCDCAFS